MGASTSLLTASKRSDVKVIVADSPFMSVRSLCEEVARRSYKLPGFVMKAAFYFIRKKCKAKNDVDLGEIDVYKTITETNNKPAILFLAAK